MSLDDVHSEYIDYDVARSMEGGEQTPLGSAPRGKPRLKEWGLALAVVGALLGIVTAIGLLVILLSGGVPR